MFLFSGQMIRAVISFRPFYLACGFPCLLVFAVLFAMVLGVLLGLVAAMVGGITDAIIMRIADVQLSFPSILIAMLIFGIAKSITP